MSRAVVVAMLTVAGLGGAAASAAPPATERAAPAWSGPPAKPTGPIAVDYRVAATPAIGVPLAVELTARVADPGARLALEAIPSDPGLLHALTPVLVASAEGRFEWSVTVVPMAADAGFLNVVVSGEIDGVAQARSVAIRVRGGAARSAPDRATLGEALIELPVEESR